MENGKAGNGKKEAGEMENRKTETGKTEGGKAGKRELGNESIAQVCKDVEAALGECGVAQRDILQTRLMVEETLLKYQEVFGAGAVFTQKCTRRLNRIRLELSLPGERFDPFDTGEEGQGEVLRGLLANIGAAPVWQYKNGENLILFMPKKKKRSQMVSLVWSVVLALLGGGLCRFLPAGIREFLINELIGPVFERFMGLLSAIAGPMVFLSVAWGIYSIGDTATMGKIGKRMIGRFLLMSVLLTLPACMAVLPLFSLAAGGGGMFDFSELFQMILDIVPGNFFTPFTEGNPLQIIFVAVLIGTAMLILGSKATVAAAFVEQSNYIVQFIMETVSSFVPLFVFGSILTMVLGNDFSVFFHTYKLLPAMLAGHMIVMGVYLVLVCTRRKVRPALLLKKMMPTFLIALTTASSSAAFGVNMECCEKELGIDNRIVNFGVPLGQVIFMPGVSVQFLAVGFCMAEIYGVTVSPVWLAMAFLIAIVLAVAAPPIPGGALTCYTILFVQLKIPMEAIAVTIALNVILEFFTTAADLFCLQAELVELAAGLDMLDTGKLKNVS